MIPQLSRRPALRSELQPPCLLRQQAARTEGAPFLRPAGRPPTPVPLRMCGRRNAALSAEEPLPHGGRFSCALFGMAGWPLGGAGVVRRQHNSLGSRPPAHDGRAGILGSGAGKQNEASASPVATRLVGIQRLLPFDAGD